MLDNLMIGFGSLCVIVLIALAFHFGDDDPETNCMGCGVLYRPSSSNAEYPLLFHNQSCEAGYAPLKVRL